jgi:cell fate regulator YaaT (PSP1 superfamily)
LALVVGVVFQPGGRVYLFDPAGLELAWNDHVICQTARGREYGRVVQANNVVPDAELTGPLKRVVRRANPDDAEIVRQNRVAAKRAMRTFREACRRHDLRLKPVSSEIVYDGGRIVFAFASDQKHDLRELQADLSAQLECRVELRAVGPREQARLCGGGGLCGGQLCCTRFPSHEQPITLRMAKDQELPMSPGRITGLCGRLRCCLAYEHPVYRSFRDRAPALGRTVETPQGRGIVKNYEVMKDSLVVQIGSTTQEVKLDDAVEVSA